MEKGINWEEVDKAKSEDELRGMKLWLFQENIRLQNERNELEDMQDKLRISFSTKSWRFCRMAFVSWTRTGSDLNRKNAGWSRAADTRGREKMWSCWGRETI